MAEKAGIPNSQQMSNIECGLNGVLVIRFKNICEVLKTETDYLLFGKVSVKGTETIMHKYIERMSSEQVSNLLELVKVYAKSCRIEEV